MMTQTPTQCPPTQDLRDYALGRLPDDVSDVMFDHVRECEVCSAELETIDDSEDSLIGSLRSPDPLAGFAEEPACHLAVAKVLGTLVNDPTSDTNRQDLPRQIGEYEVVRPLGRGGMGRVYLARHTKLGREVALKVLATHRLADPRMRQRFEGEMRAVGRLSHPNIVTAYDAREVDGTAVLVTEFIDGLDLGQLVNTTGPLRMEDACQIVRMVAVALAYSSEQGFVHRDVKPSNIMLSRSGEVKLLDLGLARLQHADPDQVEITGTGQTMGTADYIAPEQVTDSRHVDIRGDIYSLGCTLMKLLTGEAPFATDAYPTPFAKMTAHVSAPLPRLTEWLPDAPKRLVMLVGSMLEKDPNKRPQLPMQVAERLRPFTAGSDLQRLGQTESTDSAESKSQRSATVRSQAERHRHVPLWVAVAAGIVGLAIGLLMGIWITIKYPDGTTAKIAVPAGSQVTIDESGGHESDLNPAKVKRKGGLQGPIDRATAPIQELAPMQEIGDGTISPNDPLAFIILQTQENLTEAKLNEAKSSLRMSVSSDPKRDRIVTTDAGIWIRLDEDAAAPIVDSYNGNRYGLADGSSSARIGWEKIRGHITTAEPIVAGDGSPAIKLTFDDPLAKQFGELTGNHLRRQLAIVVDGTVRLAPNIVQQIRGGLRITGNFLEGEVQEIVENLGPTVSQAASSPKDFDADTEIAPFQGIWTKGISKNAKMDPDALVVFDQENYLYYSDPSTLEQIGRFSIDSRKSPGQIVIKLVYPEEVTLHGSYEFDERLTLRSDEMSQLLEKTKPVLADPANEAPPLVLDRLGSFPQSTEDLDALADKIDSRWLALIGKLKDVRGGAGEKKAMSRVFANFAIQTDDSLREIGLAFRNFHDTFRKFPGSQNVREGGYGVNGDAPYPFSWRVALLPFLEGNNDLFEQYRFDEPWDSEHNLTLVDKMPEVYRCPLAPPDQRVGETNYLGFATEEGGLGITGHSLADFTDGTSSTVLIIASQKSVPWTKPADLTEPVVSANSDVEPFKDGSIMFLNADGSVAAMSPIDRTKLRKMIIRNDGEPIE